MPTAWILYFALLFFRYTATTATYPVCNICKAVNKTITKPGMVVNMLYLGGPISCRNLNKAGFSGQIRPNLCSALQYFAFEPCGCQDVSEHTGPNHTAKDLFEEKEGR